MINNGSGIFTERPVAYAKFHPAKYGITFDIDNDGDLDLFSGVFMDLENEGHLSVLVLDSGPIVERNSAEAFSPTNQLLPQE